MSSLIVKKRYSRTKLIGLIVCTVLLISSVVALSFAWFSGVIEKPGGTITTGKIIVNAAGYQVDSPTSLTKIYAGGLDGAQNVLNDVKPDETLTDKYEIVMDANGEYTILYVVYKNTKSINVDVQLQLSIVEGANDELNGFQYYLSVVDVPLNDPANEETVQADLKSYLAGASGNLSDDDFTTKYLTGLSNDQPSVTLSSDKNYGVIRFSVRLDDVNRGDLTRYSGQTYKLKTSFRVAQVGHLGEEYRGNLWTVTTLSEFENALKLYVPGDTILVTNPITWSGDLNFNRPVRFEIRGARLTVNGSVNFSYAYSGDFYFDTSGQGQLVIVRQGGYGGNFNIDTPLCDVFFNGSGNSQPSQGDLYLQGNVYADVNFEEGIASGLNLNRIVIRDCVTGTVSDADEMKGVVVDDQSNVIVSASTNISEIIAHSPSTALEQGKTETKFVRIENRGYIGNIDLDGMTPLSVETLEYPQIYIHNYTTIGSVSLPAWSAKWDPDNEDPAHRGNTRIICELGADVTNLNAVTGFDRDDIERPNSDIDRVEIVEGDVTHLRINHYQKDVNDDYSFKTVVPEFLDEHPEVVPEDVTTLEVVCYSLPISADDYAYLNNFPNIVTLDLSKTYSEERVTPDGVFVGFKSLANLSMPQDTKWGTTAASAAFADVAPIDELYLPETYTDVMAAVWSKIKYLHILSTANVIKFPANITSTVCRNIFLANDTMVQLYRTSGASAGYSNGYTGFKQRFSLEGTHYGNLWANILPDGTAQITSYDKQLERDSRHFDAAQLETERNGFLDPRSGKKVQFDFQTLILDDVTYQVSEIYSYAFYNLVSDVPQLRFDSSSADNLTIGEYAFYKAGFRSITLENTNATVTIGRYAFNGAEALRTLDIAGAGSIGDHVFNDCKNLRYAICPKITSLDVYSFWNCNMMYVADFPSVTQAMCSFNAPVLEFARTGVISQLFPDVTEGLYTDYKTNAVFEWRSALRLYLINAPATRPADLDTSTLYNLFATNNDNVKGITRAPMPAWLYDIYYALPYGFAGDKISSVSVMSNANNTGDFAIDSYRYCYYEDGEFVQHDNPYELQYDEASGEYTGVKVCDLVYIVLPDNTARLVSCNVDDVSTISESSSGEYTTPNVIHGSDNDHNVSEIGPRAFGWSAIHYSKLSIASNTTTIGDHAFSIFRSVPNRNGLSYDFDELNLANVQHIGRYTFYVYDYAARPKGFSVISGGDDVTDIGAYAFARNELYTVSLPGVEQIDHHAFSNNANLYAVYLPSFQRETDADVDMQGRQFASTQLRFAFVGPLYRIHGDTLTDNIAIFIDASKNPNTAIAGPQLLNAISGNHIFLHYDDDTDIEYYLRWLKTGSSYFSYMPSDTPFGDLYIFGSQSGKQFDIHTLFDKATWADVSDEDRPAFTYRIINGNRVSMVDAHGTYKGEYRVVDKVGGYVVTEIGWDYVTDAAKVTATDPYSNYTQWASPYASADLRDVSKLYFTDAEGHTNIERINIYGFYGNGNMGTTTWNTEAGFVVDITGLKWMDDYAFGGNNFTKVYSDDVEIGFGSNVFRGSARLKVFEAPNAKTFGGRFQENGSYDTTTEYVVFYDCPMLSTVILPNAERMHFLFYANSNNTGLEEIFLPKLQYAYHTFQYCAKLWHVALGTGNDEGTTLYIDDNTFDGCSVLSNITLGNENMASVTIGANAFANTPLLTEINNGTGSPDEMTVGEQSYTWTNTGFKYVTNGEASCFANMKTLEKVFLENIRELGRRPFGGDVALTDIQFGHESDDYTFTVPRDILYGTPITSVDWPYVTALDTYAFEGRTDLVEVNLPKVSDVGSYAFKSCRGLVATSREDSKIQIGSGKVLEAGGVHLGQDVFWSDGAVGNLGYVYLPFVTTMDQYDVFYNNNISVIDMPELHTITENASADNRARFAFLAVYGLQQLLLPKLSKIEGTSNSGTLDVKSQSTLSKADLGSLIELPGHFFDGCTALSDVDISAATTLGSYCFQGCTSLVEISLPGVQGINAYAFNNCTQLSNIVWPEGPDAHVSLLGSTIFGNCNNLTTFDCDTITDIATGAFAYSKIETLKLNGLQSISSSIWGSNFTTLKYVEMNNLTSLSGLNFTAHAKNLTTVKLPKLQVLVGSVFRDCTALTEVDISAATILNDLAFYNCSSLQTIALPSVQEIYSQVFDQCTQLSSITWPTDGDAQVKLLGNTIFGTCDSLTTLETDKITEVAYRALRYSRIQNLKLNGLQSITTNIWGDYFTTLVNVEMTHLTTLEGTTFGVHGNNLTTVNLPALTSVADSLFNGCVALQEVNIQSATSLGTSAFNGCNTLKKVTTGSMLTTLGDNAFNNCKMLTIEGLDLSGVTDVGSSAFAGCAELDNVNLPVVQKINASAFSGCTALTTISLGSEASHHTNDAEQEQYVELLGGSIFNNCPNLTELSSDWVSNLGWSSIFSGSYITTLRLNKKLTVIDTKDVFYNWGKAKVLEMDALRSTIYNPSTYFTATLEKLIMPSLETVPASFCSGCVALQTADVSGATSIGNSAFLNCGVLTSVQVDSATSIGTSAFSGCAMLPSIELPKVQSILESAFYNCKKLSSITWPTDTDAHVSLGGGTIFGNCDELTELDCDKITEVVASAFRYSKIRTLKLNGLQSISNNIWGDNYALLENVEMTSLTSLTGTNFASFKSTLQTAKLPALQEVIESLFNGCVALKEVDVSGATILGKSAFSGCIELESFVLESGGPTVLTESVFNGCSNLTSVHLPELTTLSGANNFLNCRSLVDLQLPNLTTIGGGSNFDGCASLRDISLLNLTDVTGNYNFRNTDLDEVDLPAIKAINGDYTFDSCTLLSSAIIGPDITIIGNYTFNNCTNLGQLVMQSETETFYLDNRLKHLFSNAAKDMSAEFKLLLPVEMYDYINSTSATFGGSCFYIKLADRILPVNIMVSGPNFNYYVAKIDTISQTDYYQVVYILPGPNIDLVGHIKASVPDEVEVDGAKYNIISVAPTAWAGLTDNVTEIEFPRRMAVFHNSSMIYMPSSVEKFSIPAREAGDSSDNYFQVIGGMLFDKNGETLVAVPKAYKGVADDSIAIGNEDTRSVKVISANAFYGSSIKHVYIDAFGLYINSYAFSNSALQDLWFAGKSDLSVSYFIGSDIFSGTSAKIYVHYSLRSEYAYHDIGSSHLLSHLYTWGGEGDEYQKVPDHLEYNVYNV